MAIDNWADIYEADDPVRAAGGQGGGLQSQSITTPAPLPDQARPAGVRYPFQPRPQEQPVTTSPTIPDQARPGERPAPAWYVPFGERGNMENRIPLGEQQRGPIPQLIGGVLNASRGLGATAINLYRSAFWGIGEGSRDTMSGPQHIGFQQEPGTGQWLMVDPKRGDTPLGTPLPSRAEDRRNRDIMQALSDQNRRDLDKRGIGYPEASGAYSQETVNAARVAEAERLQEVKREQERATGIEPKPPVDQVGDYISKTRVDADAAVRDAYKRILRSESGGGPQSSVNSMEWRMRQALKAWKKLGSKAKGNTPMPTSLAQIRAEANKAGATVVRDARNWYKERLGVIGQRGAQATAAGVVQAAQIEHGKTDPSIFKTLQDRYDALVVQYSAASGGDDPVLQQGDRDIIQAAMDRVARQMDHELRSLSASRRQAMMRQLSPDFQARMKGRMGRVDQPSAPGGLGAPEGATPAGGTVNYVTGKSGKKYYFHAHRKDRGGWSEEERQARESGDLPKNQTKETRSARMKWIKANKK
jgi:hypothetical protein